MEFFVTSGRGWTDQASEIPGVHSSLVPTPATLQQANNHP